MCCGQVWVLQRRKLGGGAVAYRKRGWLPMGNAHSASGSCWLHRYQLPLLLLLLLSFCLANRWAECGTLGQLSPAAAEQLQAACTQAVTQAYADGVDALVFVPPKRGDDLTPEEAAAAEAATEAAVKIQKNKQVGFWWGTGQHRRWFCVCSTDVAWQVCQPGCT